MPVSSFSEEDLLQQWFRDNLNEAKKQLNKFPILNCIFNGLDGYEKKSYKETRNLFLDGVLPTVTGQLKKYELSVIEEIEQTLQKLDLSKWVSTEQKKLISRITSNDWHASLSVFTELMVTSRMIRRLGHENVKIYPSLPGGKVSDVRVSLMNKIVNLEITNLDTGLTEQKIEKVFHMASIYLGKKISFPNYFLIIYVNTYQLKTDTDGRIDENQSIEYLKKEIDRLNLAALQGFEGYFSFNKLMWLVDHLDADKKYLDFLDKEILENLEKTPLKEWIQSNKSELKINSPLTAISGYVYSRGTKPLIEIHSDDHFPSESSLAEKKSFLEHIIRRIDEKMSGNQLEENASNVIVVQASSWLLSTFEYSKYDFGPIKERILSHYETKKNKFLTGVLIFSHDFEKAIFTPNPHVAENSNLNASELNKLKFNLEPIKDF